MQPSGTTTSTNPTYIGCSVKPQAPVPSLREQQEEINRLTYVAEQWSADGATYSSGRHNTLQHYS